MKKILILGIGNEILQDEGVGIHVIRELAKETLPEEVELLEGGTAGMELLPSLEGVDHLIVVDSIQAEDEPGSVFAFSPEEIKIFPDGCQVSAHQVGVFNLINSAALLDRLPPTKIIGIQPKEITWGLEMSPEVAKVVPKVLQLIHEEVEKYLN